VGHARECLVRPTLCSPLRPTIARNSNNPCRQHRSVCGHLRPLETQHYAAPARPTCYGASVQSPSTPWRSTYRPRRSRRRVLYQRTRSTTRHRIGRPRCPARERVSSPDDEARTELARSPVGTLLSSYYSRLQSIANRYDSALLVGGAAVTAWSTTGSRHIGSEIRNSAYLFIPNSNELKRYDKVRLVPFSERLPFADGPLWLRSLATFLAAGRAIQPLHPGTLEFLKPFEIPYKTPTGATTNVKFVTPICLENVDPIVVARMLRDARIGAKRASFIANLSNDGWFADQQKHQHLQLLVFRCIENRVPMARSSNTGLSAFIDSTGRIAETLRPNQPDAAVRQLELDDRVTLYMNYPDWLPIAALIVVGILIAATIASHFRNPRPNT